MLAAQALRATKLARRAAARAAANRRAKKAEVGDWPVGRGSHSSSFQLSLSRFCHRQTDGTRHIPQKVLTFS